MKTEKSSKRTFMDRYSTPVILIPLILIPFLIFVFTRFSDVTTYVPFSGCVFDINAEAVDEIVIQDGNTGNWFICEEDDEIREVADYLNTYRYDYWIPDPPIARSGWSYSVALYTKDGECYSYEFASNRILVRGIWYMTNDSYFEWLVELVEEYGK